MQKRFFEYAKRKSRLTWRGFRESLGIRNHVHYRYEDCSLPIEVFDRALKVSRISPTKAKEFDYRFERTRSEIFLRFNPGKSLAELIGICLGDGHLRPYTLSIFGDKSKDTVYLLNHVLPLMRKVLKKSPRLSTSRRDENFLVLYSASAARSLHRLGLPFGNKIKQGARIPRWVFRNESYLRACLRGLFDTDGCVYGFLRKPPSRGSKAIISFEFGKGSFLAKDAQRALGRLGYLPRMMPHRNECRLAFNEDTVRFMREIRPANEKHWENFLRWHGPVV